MAQITLPNELTNGTVADATQVMANFNAIVSVVNGNLGSDNLGSITGADVTTTDINGGTNTLDNFTSRFQAGQVTFNNLGANEVGQITVNYANPYPGNPLIFLSAPPNSEVSTENESASSFTISCKNEYSSTQTVTVAWLAIYVGAF